MKLIIEKATEQVFSFLPDTDTVSMDETGLTINGEKSPQITSIEFLLIEDVTAEAFLMNVNNIDWRYGV
jgi:hypothetical protein|tara:strand:- start:2001 stop:2207 length:207 start_codon:yes stop_codon:yes gene_type:complete